MHAWLKFQVGPWKNYTYERSRKKQAIACKLNLKSHTYNIHIEHFWHQTWSMIHIQIGIWKWKWIWKVHSQHKQPVCAICCFQKMFPFNERRKIKLIAKPKWNDLPFTAPNCEKWKCKIMRRRNLWKNYTVSGWLKVYNLFLLCARYQPAKMMATHNMFEFGYIWVRYTSSDILHAA